MIPIIIIVVIVVALMIKMAIATFKQKDIQGTIFIIFFILCLLFFGTMSVISYFQPTLIY
jgi:hypothetical protein